MQAQHRLVSILQRIRQDVATLLDKEAINAACREEKYTWKNRLLNPVNTVHLFILQVLNHNTPINDVPRKSGESFTGSAYCKARKRLPLGVFKSLVRRLADTLVPRSGSAHADDDEGRWFGHRTFVMDGSSCSMPVSVRRSHTPPGAATPALEPRAADTRSARSGRDHAREHQLCSARPANRCWGVGLPLRSLPAAAPAAISRLMIARFDAARRPSSGVGGSAGSVRSHEQLTQPGVLDAGRRKRRVNARGPA